MPSSPLLGRTLAEDPPGLFKKHREEELADRRRVYRLVSPWPSTPPDLTASPGPSSYQCLISFLHHRWGNWKDGLILNIAAANLDDLPLNERFLEDKRVDFEASLAKG